MRGQCLFYLTDIIGTNLELDQARTGCDSCRPCTQATLVLPITLVVDGKGTEHGTVQWLGWHPGEAVVAQVHIGKVWQCG
mgnify:CR=1 FL=1